MAQQRPRHADPDIPDDWLTHEAAVAFFDDQARRLLGIPTEEFLRRWDDGEYGDLDDNGLGRRVNQLVMLMPVVRPDVHSKPRPRRQG